MIRPLVLGCMLFTALALSSCTLDDAPVGTGGTTAFADQNYYPTEQGTEWRFRVDTASTSTAPFVRDVARRTSRIVGVRRIDSLDYAVQLTETVQAGRSSIDTVFIRKGEAGVYLTSPTLQTFSRLGAGFPGGNFNFPKEFLVLPYVIIPGLSWELINFEFAPIPLISFYFRVKATYQGIEAVQSEAKTFRDCARIRVEIDALFPNLENPQDILNPTVIRENATIWLSRPFGIVAGRGSEAVFTLLAGRVPLNVTRRAVNLELLSSDIVQPSDTCRGRK